jgi:hypothetical protein
VAALYLHQWQHTIQLRQLIMQRMSVQPMQTKLWLVAYYLFKRNVYAQALPDDELSYDLQQFHLALSHAVCALDATKLRSETTEKVTYIPNIFIFTRYEFAVAKCVRRVSTQSAR